MRIAVSLAALALGSMLVVPQEAAATTATACTWQTSSLTVPAGASVVDVDGTDHSGGWAGTAYVSGDRWHILAWKNGTVTDYGPIGTTTAFVRVLDENRAGTIVANSTDGQWGQIKIAFRIRGGQQEQLAVLPGGTQPIAAAINDAGDIIGTNLVQRNGSWGTVVVRWPAAQPTTVVEVPGVPFNSTAIDLDEDGTLLVGLLNPATQGRIPNVLRAGVLIALPPLASNQTVSAAAISNGRVTGDVLPKNSHYIGVVWERDLTPHALPNAVSGLLINRDGLVIGEDLDPNLSHGVWRNGTQEYAFGTFADHVYTGTISDDGTFAGVLRNTPTVWRCV